MTITVSSGVTSNFLTISSGDPLVVLSGGTADYATVNSGGSATLSAGAIGENLTVSLGGVLLGPGLLEGYSNIAGSVAGVRVADDGFLELASGGTAADIEVTAPAAAPYSYFEIDSGATAFNTAVANAFVQVYGSAAGTLIGSGAEEDVFSGGVASGDTVQSGGRLVLSGGSDTGAMVQNGGLLVLSGGEAVDATVSSGGALGYGPFLTTDFIAGPVAHTTVISGVTVSSGGVVDLYDAEVAQGATVSLTSGAIGDDLLVDPGAAVEGPGALTGQTYVEGSIGGVSIGGQLELADGGTASAVTVAVDGSLQVDLGATVDGATALSGALINVLGSAVGLVIESKGEAYVNSGGLASEATVMNGGEELVYSGGIAAADTIESGGLLVLQGGSVNGETALGGATVDLQETLTGDIAAGPVADTTVVSGVLLATGAVLNVDSATVADGASVSVAAGTIVSGLDVLAGGLVDGPGELAGFTEDLGVVSGVTIGDVGLGPASELIVFGGARFGGGTIAGDGAVSLESGALAAGLVVENGGSVQGPGDLAGLNRIAGQVDGVTLVSGGGVELLAGGTASGVTVSGGTSYSELEIDSGATATGTVVESGGREVVQSGGSASGTTVLDGGRQYVLSGGSAVDAAVSAGGAEYVLASGATTGTVLSGADQFVSSGGVAVATTLSSGAGAVISLGGEADATTISSGGQEFVFGTAFGETVSSAGSESVAAGGVAIGPAVLAGGVVADDGEVRFDGAGTLAGTLSGSGAVAQTEAGTLVLSEFGAGFSGVAAIRGGTIELATAGALGTGSVEFAEPSTGSAVLQIDAGDAPAAGGTFVNTIDDFSGANEDIDLRSIAFAAGASATVSGSTLVLSDGGATYRFKLEGSIAAAYPVLGDGHGGTLIDPQAARFAQTAAAFAPADDAKTALVSSTPPTAHAPFLHAMASAGRL